MVQQGGVSVVDGEKLKDPAQTLDESFGGRVLKMGKRRFVKLLLQSGGEREEKGGEKKEKSPFPLPSEVKGPKDFALFSDGACRGNPGPGAWASVGQDSRGEVIFESSGVEGQTTNNRMEMEGALTALLSLDRHLMAEPHGPTLRSATSSFTATLAMWWTA